MESAAVKIEMELWHLVLLLLAFFGFTGAVAKLLLDQFEKRLVEKFKAQAEARAVADAALNAALERHLDEEKKTTAKIVDLEKDFLRWQAELPVSYVRREDYIRGQTVLEAKMDALYSKLELVHLKGSKND